MRSYTQVVDTGNEEYRDKWVADALHRHLPKTSSPTLLDVGAGQSPYKQVALAAGYEYKSHDFNAFIPTESSPGLQTASWNYSEHNFVCDIVDLPSSASADVLICTEVLEHVPDPVRAFERMASLVNDGGSLIVTVPFLSLMHQSPYWFQSGLSPFWFEHWANKTDLEVCELIVQGDYIDLMSQEMGRVLNFRPRIKGLPQLGSSVVRRLRGRLPEEVLQSGGIGTLL